MVKQNLDNKDILTELQNHADFSYSPYSHFRVVAALITEKNIYYGINIENRSYGLTICAERVAIGNALTHNDHSFIKLYIYSPDSTDPLPPCGACRQVISEFSNNLPIIMVSKSLKTIETSINELLPYDSLEFLKKKFYK